MIKRELFYGRLVSSHSLYMISEIPKDAVIFPAIKDNQCQRCFTMIEEQWYLPNGHYYCDQCAILGRLSTRDVLITLREPRLFKQKDTICLWTGQLNDAQERVAAKQCESFLNHRSHLTYAVTGAGKTEMLYPLLTLVIKQNKRIALVSPRSDVIRELEIRIRQHFNVSLTVLYAGMEKNYCYSQLLLATTHQLVKFRQAFDVVILDEADAFPYAGNPLLERGVLEALATKGIIFYLTATPNHFLNTLSRKGLIDRSILSKRYHGYPLPEIELKICGNWRKNPPRLLLKLIKGYKELQIKFLIFVPEISDLELILKQVIKQMPDIKLHTVNAKDPERLDKITLLRNKKIDGLVTTSILERGVTFPGIQVVIMGGEEAIFSKASLIQMAGRVGRSRKEPVGRVIIFAQEKTKTILKAQSEIRYLNATKES